MTWACFLSSDEREYLQRYINKRKAPGLEVRRANALLALDKGHDEKLVCDIFEIGNSTLQSWLLAYKTGGLDFLKIKSYSAREGHLNRDQEQELATTLRATHSTNTNEIRAHILTIYGQNYSRSGCLKLLHRLGFAYKKPEKIPAIADEKIQKDFITAYENLYKNLPDDETIYFGDAVHPDHQVRPAHGWFHKDDRVAVKTNSGRKRINIHGALCLENFDVAFVEVEKVNANSTIALFEKLEALNPDKKVIHVILDNARYHHAHVVQEWLKRPDCSVKIRWLPPYSPHLNSIERLWGVMHKYVTHNKFYKTYDDFRAAILGFLTETIPQKWKDFRDTVSDNFKVLSIHDCKIIS